MHIQTFKQLENKCRAHTKKYGKKRKLTIESNIKKKTIKHMKINKLMQLEKMEAC